MSLSNPPCVILNRAKRSEESKVFARIPRGPLMLNPSDHHPDHSFVVPAQAEPAPAKAGTSLPFSRSP